MTKIIVTTDNAPKSMAYSQGVIAGGFVFVAGQGPFDPHTGEVVGTTIQEQTAQCLKNIDAILHTAGSSLDKIVTATFILDDPNDFAGMNEEWLKWFPKRSSSASRCKAPHSVQRNENLYCCYRRGLELLRLHGSEVRLFT